MAIFKSLSPALSETLQVKALDAERWQVTLGDSDSAQEVTLQLQHVQGSEYQLTHQGQTHALYVDQQADRFQVLYQGRYYNLQRYFGTAVEDAHSGDQILAPLTGKVIQVNAEVGQAVQKGDTLVVLESMKMETALAAPRDGVIESVHCQPQDQVANEQVLVQLVSETATDEEVKS